MSIQQSINQMLMSAQIGAGFYAHSPTGQKQAAYKEAKKEFQKTEEKYPQWSEPTTEDEVAIYEQMSQRQADLASKMYSIKPTETNYEQYKNALSGLTERIEGKASLKAGLKERKEIIKGGKR